MEWQLSDVGFKTYVVVIIWIVLFILAAISVKIK